MQLKTRLAQLQNQTGSGMRSPAPVPVRSDLQQRLAGIKQERLNSPPHAINRRLANAGLTDRLEGRRIAEGVIQIDRRFPLNGRIGRFALASLSGNPRLPGETGHGERRNVYIDTETTGLSGGSGTIAFLIGIAVVDDAAIKLRQFLLTGFAGEVALLGAFSDTLSASDRLVSYNGKSYDLPLLLTRFRMQGLSHPFAGRPHLDLLHATRRLFGKHWPDCRLTTLEDNLLGFSRAADRPGAEAPAAWFSWLRHGWAEKLIRVVRHNQQDIVSLAAAHTALAQAAAQPTASAVDLHALARWLAETDVEPARALLAAHAGLLCDDGKRLLGQLARRAGDWPLAVEIWEQLAAGGCSDALERLAKYHEHISKDLFVAKHYAEKLPVSPAQVRRLSRLRKKLHGPSVQ